MTKLRIVALVVDKVCLTLYHEDGKTSRIEQGDPRLQRIIDESKDALLARQVAEVDISIEETPPTTNYQDFEKSTGGLVRFFRVAKAKIKELFSSEDEPAEEAPMVPNIAMGAVPDQRAKIDAALADIMAHAEPMTNDELDKDQTVVAVVNDTPIVGAEKLQRQIAHANKLGSPKALEAFFARMATVASKRQHTAQELMHFLERADLPIAEDGSIIIYKVLNRRGEHTYVDCHTNRVVQRVGSFVCMDEKLIDPSRRTQCSTGLHVARRGYLRTFPGTACTLGKVAPEDVIAVPHNEPDKMRVAGYHIIFELTDDMFLSLKQGKPMTDHPEGKTLLAAAIAGHHAPPIEEVRITSAMGGSFETKALSIPNAADVTVAMPSQEAEAIDLSDPKKPVAPAVDPTALSKQVTEQKVSMTQAQSIQSLIDTMQSRANHSKVRAQAAEDLLAIRARTKRTWEKLGFPTITDQGLKAFIDEMGARKSLHQRPVAQAPTKTAPPKKDPMAGLGPRQATARALYEKQQWAALLNHKQKVKISWEKLSFTPQEIAVIKTKIA
jgi:hypothetical protein